jgi:hypothetical protein
MRTVLWATLSANGNYAQSKPDNPPLPEALRDFAEHAKACGNFVVGRKTFEGFMAQGPNPAFAGLDIIVVSKQPLSVPGITWAPAPRVALEHLRERGHKTAFLSGGGESAQCLSGRRARRRDGIQHRAGTGGRGTQRASPAWIAQKSKTTQSARAWWRSRTAPIRPRLTITA